MKTQDTAYSRLDIPENEKREIVELYRSALLQGSSVQVVNPSNEVRTLPPPIFNLLVQILKDLSEGSSVTVLQEQSGLTTIQASQMLGVSRQHLVNLLEKGEIPFHKVGTHRRILFRDLMDYKDKRDKNRRSILREMARAEMEAGVYEVVSEDDLAGE